MTPRRDVSVETSGRETRARHVPVLLAEVLAALAPAAGEQFVDATFGAGGYTRAILEAADCAVLALDRDPTAIAAGGALVAEVAGRLRLVETPFGDMIEAVADAGLVAVDGVVLDIGVSSMQLDCAERGFSFQHDGPLDMRMSSSGLSAADVVNEFEESRIADILYQFGEEHRSRAIAKAIVAQRRVKPLARTLELADLVTRALGGRRHDQKAHPATRTFQALRIYVNDELGELRRVLHAAERILKPGGRLVVVTFHSLEDRIVKQFLTPRTGREARGSRYLPDAPSELREPSFRIVNRRPLTSSQDELEVNPRARSARLRAATRTDAAIWPTSADDLDDRL